MTIQLVGMSHKTAPVEVRERLAVSDEGAGALARQLAESGQIREALVLSTCNRVEFLASGEADALHREVMVRFGGSVNGAGSLYHLTGRQAVRHVFRVAASLDSMVVGEPQILGQVKEAYHRARAAGALGGPLDSLVSTAFRVARRVRNETEIGKMAVSVSHVAVQLARKIFGDLDGRDVLLVGAGEMAEAAARQLVTSGTSLSVTNRTLEGAQRLAAEFGAAAVPFERLLELLQTVDIVVSSTGAPGFILSRRTAEGVIAARRNRPIFLVDIAVPRDIDPRINEIDNMFVYDIDDLQQVAASNMEARRQEAEIAERIVEDEVDRSLRRLRARSADPAIVSLNRRLETIRRRELERHGAKLRSLTREQREVVDHVTRGIIGKIAHRAIVEVKRGASEPGSGVRPEDVRRIFGIE